MLSKAGLRIRLFVALFGCLASTAPAADKSATAKERTLAKPGSAADSSGVQFLRVPEEGLQPQTIVDDAGVLHLIYFRGSPGAGDVYYVRRAAGEREFSRPIRVNSQEGSAIAMGSIRGAQLAVGKGGRVHVAWNGSGTAEPKGPGKYSNPMLYSRSNDAGTGFEPQRNVFADASGLDGGGTVAADQAGNVYVAWHAGDGSGEASRRVWFVHSADEGATFAPQKAADAEKNGACGCCGMKGWADREGNVYFLYRSARQSSNRDMQLLVSQNGGRSFASELVSRWNIATCPMSSESFAEGPSAVVGAWETEGQVFFSRIDKATGKPSKPIAAPGSSAGRKHPALAVNSQGHTLLVWDEGTGWERGGKLAWQVFDKDGKPTPDKGRQDGIPVWSFAAAYVDGEGKFVIVY